ncbi:NADP-dependent oxidoreductase [Streptomyces sp. NPDC088921]|uniref:NADP-dependent oxidoreductase n=1 Tax=unclassified Streptomyces TaxID=2593676 RepID=UPI00342A2B65
MKAVQFREYGGPEVLEVVETDEPHAGPGKVRIAVRATAVNPPDWKIRSGTRREVFPRTLPAGVGFEASGVVDEVGEGVTDVSIGDAVFGFGDNTYAEFAILDNWVLKPEKMSFEEAAAVSAAGETALRVLDKIGVKRGETLVISGAAGGVGSAVVQLARRRGAKVVGTDSPAKQDYLRSLGAEPTTYEAGWVDRVKALAPEGVDAALDLAGADVIADLIELTGDPLRVGTIMLSAADKGVVTTYERAEYPERLLAELARAFEEGAFHMRVDRTFSLAETGEAQRVGAEGTAMGRLVVVVS